MPTGKQPAGPNVWIAAELKKKGRRQVELARHLGVSESVMTKIIHRASPLDVEQDRKIRDFLVSNVQSDTSRYASQRIVSSVRHTNGKITVPSRAEMTEDLPVYGTALGGSQGGTEFIMNGEAGLYVRRPEKLIGRDDVFALYVQGDSMEPRYYAGELIICEANRPPTINDFVVVEMKETVDGYRVAYLKQLAARSGGKIKLRQFNPDKTIEMDQADVHQIVRVLSTQDLLS